MPDALQGVIGDAADCNFMANVSDIVGNSLAGTVIDPGLNPLSNKGGRTETYSLQSSSPALDAGDPNGCQDFYGNILTYDQRGFPYSRTLDGNGDGIARCDIGAFEW